MKFYQNIGSKEFIPINLSVLKEELKFIRRILNDYRLLRSIYMVILYSKNQ